MISKNVYFIFPPVAAERCTFFHHECSGTTCTDGAAHCVLGTCRCTQNTGHGMYIVKRIN